MKDIRPIMAWTCFLTWLTCGWKSMEIRTTVKTTKPPREDQRSWWKRWLSTGRISFIYINVYSYQRISTCSKTFGLQWVQWYLSQRQWRNCFSSCLFISFADTAQQLHLFKSFTTAASQVIHHHHKHVLTFVLQSLQWCRAKRIHIYIFHSFIFRHTWGNVKTKTRFTYCCCPLKIRNPQSWWFFSMEVPLLVHFKLNQPFKNK